MVELPLIPYWDRVVKEFETENKCSAYHYTDELIQYLKDRYKCEYWQREEQYGGPCFVFKVEQDSTFFMLRFG